jgi:hypothetical protein
MADKFVILTPKGGGGSWLTNLIWHLETSDFSLPDVDIFFDGEQRSSIEVKHPFYYDADELHVPTFDEFFHKINFSTDKPFNLYLNEVIKIRLNPKVYDCGKLSYVEQFDILTNSAKANITDPAIKQYYHSNIDLDYRLIFQDPNKFIDQLFKILDTAGINYIKNRDYCRLSIANYKRTCPDPDTYIGNWSNIIWLAWCHALVMVYDLKLPQPYDFSQVESEDDCIKILAPLKEKYIELTESLYFKWINQLHSA